MGKKLFDYVIGNPPFNVDKVKAEVAADLNPDHHREDFHGAYGSGR